MHDALFLFYDLKHACCNVYLIPVTLRHGQGHLLIHANCSVAGMASICKYGKFAREGCLQACCLLCHVVMFGSCHVGLLPAALSQQQSGLNQSKVPMTSITV